MFSASTKRERVRVSQACVVCSARKTKCDGRRPRCEICVLNGRECEYGTSRRNTRMNSARRRVRSDEAPAAGMVVLPAAELEEMLPGQIDAVANDLSRAAKEELFRTYFTCIHPIWPLLYKPMYDGVGYGDLMGVLPLAVVCAIFAIASCLHSESEGDNGTAEAAQQQDRAVGNAAVPVPPTTTTFFQAALVAMQRVEKDSGEHSLAAALEPSIPNCQALAILALQQHGVAEFSRAGVFCSLAAAMALDLRLHRDAWSDDALQREVASRLWWNLFVLDKMLASEMGRPVVLRVEDTDAPYPSVAESDEFELFHRAGGGLEGPVSRPSVKLRSISAFHTTIEASKLMERVSREIYSLASRARIKLDRNHGERVRMDLSRALDEWEANVDVPPLKLDLQKGALTPPAMVTNYVSIKYLRILLHRPFITYWEQTTHNTHAHAPAPDPAAVCLHSARAICLILESYSTYLARLPSDLIFVVFVATEILFRHSQRASCDGDERVSVQRSLRLCLHWLGVFGRNWRSASARQMVLEEQYTWPPPAALPPQQPSVSDAICSNSDESLPVPLDVYVEPPPPPLPLSSMQGLQMPLAFGAGLASEEVDGALFSEMWNEVRDWGFFPNAEDALFAYDI